MKNEETSDDLKDLKQDDQAQRTTEEVPDLSAAEEEDGGEGAQLEYSEDGEADLTAEAGEDSAPTDAVSPDAEAQGVDGDEPGGAGEAGEAYEPNAAAETYKQVVDAYGRKVDIPENVDQVAAVGELAMMVMMLDSAQRLAATNSDLTSAAALAGLGGLTAGTVFSGLAQVPALWSGSGGSPLSDSDFQLLLEAAPDVVLETSGSGAVTDSQAALLEENGIAYLVLPEPTSTGNIRTIMTALGTVLGDRSGEGGANAPQNAAAYLDWVDSVTQVVSQATAGYAAYTDDETGESVSGTYTLFVNGWDDEAYYRLYSDRYVTLSGYGCAVVYNGATAACKTLSSYLGVANVVNTSAQYGIVPKALYFTPLISAYRTMEVAGSGADGMVTPGQPHRPGDRGE